MESREFLEKVTRVEVIDITGRAYTCHNASAVECQLQDNGRTLKVFLNGVADATNLPLLHPNPRNKMSREIKFRAWAHEEGRMYHGVECGVDLGIEVHFRDILDGWPGRNFSVMQYTGLKDREGREIYEGDIVNRLHGDGLGVVTWDQGTCSFDIVNGGSSEHLYDTTGSGDLGRNEWEVFGNIHEHPELLSPTN